MNCQRICPFHGQHVEQCDVGFGYISPYHVEVIVRHCTSRYEDCGKYRELATRELLQDDRSAREEPNQPLVHKPAGGSLLPLRLDREVISLVQHALRTPLTSIRSFTEILLSYPIDDPESRRRFLQIIHEEVERLTHAINLIFGAGQSEAQEAAQSATENVSSSSLSELTTQAALKPKEAKPCRNH
jgi:signal transduction histidine kinase